MSDQNKSLLDSILKALGFNPVQVRWRWRRRRQAWKDWYNRTENKSRSLRYDHKTCHACNAPVDREAKTCPRCGVPLAGAAASRLNQLFRLIVPEGAQVYTTLIGITIVAIFGAMLVKGGMGMLWPSSLEARQAQTLLGLQLGSSHVFYYDLERLCGALKVMGLGSSCPEAPHAHRLVTSMFVHFGILHIVFNAYALMQLGPLCEEIYGRSRFLLIYLVTGVGASLASAYWHWDRPVHSAGASGALLGLMGASLVYGLRGGTAYSRTLANEMIKWAVFVLIFGLLVPAVDNAAHIGGAITGGLLALIIPDQRSPSKIPLSVWTTLELLSLAVIIGSFVALFALHDPLYELIVHLAKLH